MGRRDIYESLNESLEIDARSIEIDTKIMLSQIMKTGGYHIKGRKDKKKKLYPTPKQLNYAWGFLKQKNLISYKTSKVYYQEEYISSTSSRGLEFSYQIKRVKKGQTVKIGDKLYRGGQFLPKKYGGE